MATNRNSNTFAEPVSEVEETVATPVPAAGAKQFNFEDGKTFNIPVDLFEHLKKHGNIYDTL
jgi:hypothetical protein